MEKRMFFVPDMGEIKKKEATVCMRRRGGGAWALSKKSRRLSGYFLQVYPG
jgi:hypothetical protein